VEDGTGGPELKRQALESGLGFADIRGKSDDEVRTLMQGPAKTAPGLQ
jgi:hypothetical protein